MPSEQFTRWFFVVCRSVIVIVIGIALCAGCASTSQTQKIRANIKRIEMRGYDSSESTGSLIAIGEPAIPALLELFEHETSRVRMMTALTLAAIGNASVPYLIEKLHDESMDVRDSACYALGEIRPPAKNAVSPLAQHLKDRHWRVRRTAAKALASMGTEAKIAIPQLIVASTEDEEPNVRNMAALAVVQIILDQ